MLTPAEQEEIHALAKAWAKAAVAYQRDRDKTKRLGSPVFPLLKKAREAEQALVDHLKEVG